MPSDRSDQDLAVRPGEAAIVLSVAEIFLKGKNRRQFFRVFLNNAARLLADIPGARVLPLHLRALVLCPADQVSAATLRLGRLFGLAQMAPAAVVAPDLDAIAEAALARAARFPADASFKVETNRRDKRFALTSLDVSREVGGRIVEAYGLRVDVHQPDFRIDIEIDTGHAFVRSEAIPGPGGLPVGTAGNVSLLLSGGIDSPVAGWYAMRRGCRLSAIYFHSFPYTGDKTKEKVLDLAGILARWHGPIPVHVVHFTDVQKKLRAHVSGELAVLAYRRMMMRAASLIAEREHALALITGENLGQVASQTLENLAVIEDAASLPILRPLIGFDKLDIIARARQIGTYETSIQPYEDCCSLFVPKHPATRARAEKLARAEEGLEIEAMAQSLADGVTREVIGPNRT